MRIQARSCLPFVVLVVVSLACGGRVFEEVHVYSSPQVPLLEAYNPTTGVILTESVWVFYPDGTFRARVSVCGDPIELSGTYSGDDVGMDFFFFLDTNGDGTSDDRVELDVEEDAYSYIDWECDGQLHRFWLAQ